MDSEETDNTTAQDLFGQRAHLKIVLLKVTLEETTIWTGYAYILMSQLSTSLNSGQYRVHCASGMAVGCMPETPFEEGWLSRFFLEGERFLAATDSW